MKRFFTVPNLITFLRLLSVPVLAILMLTGNREGFRWLLLAALASDVLDGFIARTFNMESELGSKLDAMADTLVYVVVVIAIPLLQGEFLRAHWVPLAVMLTLYFAEKIKCFLKFGKWFNAFHNYSAKVMGYVQGIFILSLFFFGFLFPLFALAIGVGILANIEDMALTSILPTYEHDTKGLFWVLRRMKKEEAA